MIMKRGRGRKTETEEFPEVVSEEGNGLAKEHLLGVVAGVDAAGAAKELSAEGAAVGVGRPKEAWQEPAAEGEQEEKAPEGEEAEWDQEMEGAEVLDDPVRMYLREIGRVHLLTSKDERVLARKMEGGRHLENLEKELLQSEGRPPKAWEVCSVLLRRLGRAAPTDLSPGREPRAVPEPHPRSGHGPSQASVRYRCPTLSGAHGRHR